MKDNSSDRQGGWTGLWPRRRSVLRAVGAGATLPFVTGVGASSATGEMTYARLQEEQEEDEDGNGDGDSDSVTAHVIHLLETFPATNPNRPLDFFFQPTGLHIQPGDVLKFIFDTPRHTVTSYSNAFGQARRTPEGARPFSSPILGWVPGTEPDFSEEGDGEEDEEETTTEEENGDTGGNSEQTGPVPEVWLLTLEKEGVYDIYCAPHEAFGMVMRVVVGDVADEDVDFEYEDPEALPEEGFGPVGLAREVLTDPQLTPAAIQEAGKVMWNDLDANQTDGTNGDGNGTNGDGTDDDPNGSGQ